MADLRTAPTAALDAQTLADARAVLDAAFGDEMTELDWQHALGGLHALAYEDGVLVGHGSVVGRALTVDGRPMHTGYVEGVAVHPRHRRLGHGAAIMAALERAIREQYELGALGSTDEAAPFYARRGWTRWEGATVPDGEGAVWVLPVGQPIDADGELACDWREGDLW